MDRAGPEKNATLFADMLNATGRKVLIENNNAKSFRDQHGTVQCPMHLFRTGPDARPTYGNILTNMLTMQKFNGKGLTGPGCWAHPDMLSVGVTVPQPPGAKNICKKPGVPCEMTLTEMRTNFGAW